MPYTYQYPHPAVTVDAVVLGFDDAGLQVLLIQRKSAPHRLKWALPGGFVEIDESLADAVRRELREETGLAPLRFEQLHTFGAPRRDPRERVISVAYYAPVRLPEQAAQAASDARDVAWFPVSNLPPLAFDHGKIIELARDWLREKSRDPSIALELLPERFALSELQRLYEAIFRRPLGSLAFQRKVLATGLLRATGETRGASRLYRFDESAARRRKKAEPTFHWEP